MPALIGIFFIKKNMMLEGGLVFNKLKRTFKNNKK